MMSTEYNEQSKPNAAFFERMRLFDDTVACKKTDRIVVAPQTMFLPAYLYGEVTFQDVMMDYAKAEDSWIRYHQEFQPDLAWGPQSIFPCAPLDDLDCQYVRWPGKQIADPNASFQIVDREDGYMDAEEYLEYAEDPTGFMMRKVLPRHFAGLKGLEMTNLSNTVWQGALYSMIPFALPPVQEAFAKMGEAGRKMMHMAEAGGNIMKKLTGLGFPSACDCSFAAPFDVFNDTLRGFLNTTMDMIEYPDELLAAVNACTKMVVREIKDTFKRNTFAKNAIFFIHNGFDMFMSREQFETFYWPGLKACVDAVIECGGVPRLYIEDKYDDKMDILARDLPAGKCIVTLINCDVEKAKTEFDGKICLCGGMDGTILQYGSKEQVIKAVKDTIDRWAPGGGYIFDTDVSLDVAKAENLHAMYDTAKSYIKY